MTILTLVGNGRPVTLGTCKCSFCYAFGLPLPCAGPIELAQSQTDIYEIDCLFPHCEKKAPRSPLSGQLLEHKPARLELPCIYVHAALYKEDLLKKIPRYSLINSFSAITRLAKKNKGRPSAIGYIVSRISDNASSLRLNPYDLHTSYLRRREEQ